MHCGRILLPETVTLFLFYILHTGSKQPLPRVARKGLSVLFCM